MSLIRRGDLSQPAHSTQRPEQHVGSSEARRNARVRRSQLIAHHERSRLRR